MGMRMMLEREQELHTAVSRKGKFPKKAVLLAPHTNELHSTIPFQSALVEKLNSLGVKTEIHNRKNMMERTWEIRKFILADCKEFSHNGVLSAILSLEDHVLRLNAFSEIFLNSPQDILIGELHAMSGDVLAAGTILPESHHFMRVPDARVLVCTDLLGAFRETRDFASLELEEADRNISESHKKQFNELVSTFLTKLKEHFGLDAGQLLSEVDALLAKMEFKKEHLMIFELPSTYAPIDCAHEMHGHYFYPNKVINTSNTSEFEDAYSTGYRYSVGFTFRDVDAVAGIIRFPN